MLTLPADPYLALGVSRDAQLPEIRTAYRKLILKCHPDKIQDPLLKQLKQDEFQRVQQAYELLSSETEKEKYDDMYKLNELQKEMSKMSTSSPAGARSSRRDREPEYYGSSSRYSAEPPKSSSYPSPSSKTYAPGAPPSRSHEEFTNPSYEPHLPRKTASYERGSKSDWDKRTPRDEREDKYERKSKKDDKRDRDEKPKREKEEKEKRDKKEERKKEKKEAERKEKERRKEKEIKEERKKAEQTRRKDADFKTSQQKTYRDKPSFPVEYSSDSSEEEVPRVPRAAAGSRDKVQPVATSDRERKYSETMDIATQYLQRSGAKVSVNGRVAKPQATEQFHTKHGQASFPAVPTPPPVGSGPHAPPPGPPPPHDIYEDEEAIHTSSAKNSSRRDKSSYKKSGTRGTSRDPLSREYTAARGIPSFQKAYSMPTEFQRGQPGRSHTEYTVRTPAAAPPPLSRSRTDYPRERSRSRQRRELYSEDDDSDGERHRHRSSRRHPATFTYTVEPNKISTRQVPQEELSRHHKSGKPSYYTANTSARMDPAGSYDEYGSRPMNVNYSPIFGEESIKYTRVPHTHGFTSYRSEELPTY